MNGRYVISEIKASEILDSRGNPTVQVQIQATDRQNGTVYQAKASVPSGASTGQFEAVELRDGEQRYRGLGVERAVSNVNTKIREALLNTDVLDQRNIDHHLIKLDGTDSKANLGANATLGVSMAAARVASEALGIPLYRYLGGSNAHVLPVPMMNIMNGGKHAKNTVDFQEFMIMPVGACCFKEKVRICSEIYHVLQGILKNNDHSTGVGDEGGFAPNMPDTYAVLDVIIDAVKQAGYEPDKEICLALDAASSELYDEKDGMYHFPGEEVIRDTAEMISYYEGLLERYPLCSIEDGLAEDDWDGWKELTKRMGKQVTLVGDDLFVTNTKRLEAGIKLQVGNAILVKVNQIGTVTEAMEAIEMAQKAGYHTIISHRSGETADTFIADLAVATNAGYIKTGAPCRAERTEKYNRLLEIEEELKSQEV